MTSRWTSCRTGPSCSLARRAPASRRCCGSSTRLSDLTDGAAPGDGDAGRARRCLWAEVDVFALRRRRQHGLCHPDAAARLDLRNIVYGLKLAGIRGDGNWSARSALAAPGRPVGRVKDRLDASAIACSGGQKPSSSAWRAAWRWNRRSSCSTIPPPARIRFGDRGRIALRTDRSHTIVMVRAHSVQQARASPTRPPSCSTANWSENDADDLPPPGTNAPRITSPGAG